MNGTAARRARVLLRRELRAALAERELWIFGYGSLMWDPGFRHVETAPALLHGWHRRFCVYSHRYRGTADCPGLVLGLDRGGHCWGMAYRVARRDAKAVLHYLWDRELDGGVYRMKRVRLRLKARAVRAYAFTVNRGHQGYAGLLTPEQTAQFIHQGNGARGPCRSYLENTVRHLTRLGLADRTLHRLIEIVVRAGASDSNGVCSP